ncbi:MAG: T9SS type A sorting domain-containing protein [Reichenbachiella sp.]|uniref:T9SS type A sorting domain-containing protein n=1 Tax=Reichenbachiella sp. TaxID=2184521 RepID=UPI003296A3A6
MKRIILIITIMIGLNQFMLGQTPQENHLSLIYDFDGEDFDYSVKGMVGTNDSLYIISTTPNGQGVFFRIDENGDGYEVIWEYDDVNYAPSSLIANDTVIFGTTRFSANGGGTIFQYSLLDYSFKFVKDFDPFDVQEVRVKYLTDSVLWLSSLQSFVDEGSIFIINKDGTSFEKIYDDTNMEKGQNPVDFIFHQDKIYIACFNGGGTPYSDGVGGTVASGSFIRINTDGTGYESIVKGSDEVGTQPQSLIIQEDKIIGLFAYSGSNSAWGGQFFRCNIDGTSYDSLGALDNRALGKLLSTDSLIYGISANNVFGVNPFDGEIRIFDDLQSNPDFGYDVVSNPAYLNGDVFIAAQQGGPNSGGTILKWLNEDPEENESNNDNARVLNTTSDINLNELFTDPEGDLLTFSVEYDEQLVNITESSGILTLTPLTLGEIDVKVTATDGWAGYNSSIITLTAQDIDNIVADIDEQAVDLYLYPNPTYSILKFAELDLELIEFLGLDGKLHLSISKPKNEINVSSLKPGVYVVRTFADGKYHSQKMIKH